MFVIIVQIKANAINIIYRLAQKHYEEQLVNSRTGVDIKPNEIDDIEQQIVPLIKNNKQSVNQVYINHPDVLFFSKTTFYKYVDIGVLSLTNSDLPKKIRYKKRKHTKNKEMKENGHLIFHLLYLELLRSYT